MNKCPKCGSENHDLLTVMRNDMRNQYRCRDCGNDFIDPPFTVFDRITQSPEVLAPQCIYWDSFKYRFISTCVRTTEHETYEGAFAATLEKLMEVMK